MNQNKVLAGSLVVLSIIFGLILYFAVPSDTKLYAAEKFSQLGLIVFLLLKNIIFLLSLFTSALLMGMFIYLGIHKLDRIVEKDIEFTVVQETLIVVGFGFVVVLIQVLISKPILEAPDTWIRPIADWVGIHGKNPFLWGFYGLVTYLIGYFLVGRTAERLLNTIVAHNPNTANR